MLFVTDGGMSPALFSAERGTLHSTASFTLLGINQLPFPLSPCKATQNLITLFVTGNLHCRVCVCVCVRAPTACRASQWPICEHEYPDTVKVFFFRLVQDVPFAQKIALLCKFIHRT